MNGKINLKPFLLGIPAALILAGCSTGEVVTGAGVGGAAYEYSNKRAMDDLKEDYEEGKISREEYERRKEEIEDRSLVY